MSTTSERVPRVLLAVTGGIAAYKACELLRELQKAGCEVRVTMTADAERFVGKVTFQALSGHDVADDLYAYPGSPIPHIELSEWADVACVCPATANVLGKLAAGIADDCLTSTMIAFDGPVVVAPGMNVRMWRNAATQANVATLEERGMRMAGPVSGRLACGDVGEGKLEDVQVICDAVLAELDRLHLAGALPPASLPSGPLAGKGVVVTAGPTRERIDPVRYISNDSSGKMGYALAAEAASRGAHVTLVSGPVSIAAPEGVEVVRVESAAQMLEAATDAFADATVAVCCAAVADYAPVSVADHKLKKGVDELGSIRLARTPDILATLSAGKGDRIVVGFAAETDDLLANAQAKLDRKGCDMIVANDVSCPDSTFGSDTNRVALLRHGDTEYLPTMEKREVAAAILDRVEDLLREAGEEAHEAAEAAPAGEGA